MILATPYSKLIHFDQDGNRAEFTPRIGLGLLRKIEWNARLSHASEDTQTEDSWKRFITSVVMERGDWSVVEHAGGVTVDSVFDRGISHEWVRHRLFSFTQSSTRFINYAKKKPAEFIQPDFYVGGAGNADSGGPPTGLCRLLWKDAVEYSEKAYQDLIAKGVAPQIARSVLPNALATRISTTGNLRNWRHLLLMRTTKEAHPQIREVTIPLLAEFKTKIPILFDDIQPLSRQVDNLKLPR